MMKQYYNLIKQPSLFFKWDVEKSILKVLLFFLAPFTMILLSEIILTLFNQNQINLNQVTFILIFLLSINLIVTLLIFTYSFLAHIIIKKFLKHKTKFLWSFKAITIGLTTFLPYMFLLMIIGFLLTITNIPQSNNLISIVLLLIPLAGYVHMLIIQTIGFMTYNKFDVKNALISSLVPAILILIISITIFVISTFITG